LYWHLLKGNYTLKNRELHIFADTQNDTVKSENNTVNAQFDTVKSENDTVNDTVFSLIEQNSQITAHQISDRLNMSISTVRRKIRELKNSGKIERIGSDKTGHWKITQ
jgi:predicted HTH transcriptional regulator